MTTTIQISGDLHNELVKRKIFSKESYEDIIWDLIEDTSVLSEETKRDIKRSEADIKAGRLYSLESVKKELGL